MKIQFHNTPEPQDFSQELVQEKPTFVSYQPDFVLLEKLANKFGSYKKIILIGHGGSITTFTGMHSSLKTKSNKEVFLVSTIDPDFLTQVKSSTSPLDTVVVAVSKSGETVTQLEALLQFIDYPLIVVTGPAGPLAEIAHKLSAETIIHPPIGGRFSGFTEATLVPATLCGFDVKQLFEGGQSYLQLFTQDNLASQSASVFYQLEQQGIVDVFLPVYSSGLFGFSNLIAQLCHESFGKNGKGQTYFIHEAPESQHHTNQRFLNGRTNIAGWFIGSESFANNLITKIPEALNNIPLKDQSLSLLSNISLQDALNYERVATITDAKRLNIPVVDFMLADLSESSIGQFVAFWQLYAVYSAVLRGVDPHNQPAVEASKKISFSSRLNH